MTEQCLFFDRWKCFKDSTLKDLGIKFHNTDLSANIKNGHPCWQYHCIICQLIGLRTDTFKSRRG